MLLSAEARIVFHFNRGYFHIDVLWLGVQHALASRHSRTGDAGWEKKA